MNRTNYYVDIKGCTEACAHCTRVSRYHVLCVDPGYRAMLIVDTDWPVEEALPRWIERVKSGTPVIGGLEPKEISLEQLLSIVMLNQVHPAAQLTTNTDFYYTGFHFKVGDVISD